MDNTPVHRELLLPTATKVPPAIPPLVWTSGNRFWLEIHRETSGRVRYSVGSTSATELVSMMIHLENTRAGVTAGAPVECALATRVPRGIFARAVSFQRHHHLPIRAPPESDPAGYLLRTLSSQTLQGHDMVLQLLFRRVRGWESGFFSPRYEGFAQRQNRDFRIPMDSRRIEAAYHVELRVRLSGPHPSVALDALGAWLEQWTTSGGFPWRTWKLVPVKTEWDFHAAFESHDLGHFAGRKGRRDVSATELAHLLSIPWAAHHPECSYAGAPTLQPGTGSALSPSYSPAHERPHGGSTVAPFPQAARASTRSWSPTPPPDNSAETRLAVGVAREQLVGLPREWNHLTLLGRTQSGKSTLALNLVLQILVKQPAATVVVIEPTGTLVDGIVSRLPREVAEDAIEIDPARATFRNRDTTMVSVPLSLIQPPEQARGDAFGQERWSESLAGDLLTAIRSAWGEESIGGRAEFVLRALVQGLSLTPGSNLVDAYHILSSKQALERFVKTAPPGPLRNFLESHLPRLGYDFTMSSLDKVGKIATNPLLRIALCQRSHPVSFDRLLDHRLLLLNLSKSAVGADGANFLGAVWLTQLWSSLQRSGRPERPVYLVIDEAHNYAVPTLADMLSEGAKFGLHVVAITQYLHRVPPRTRAALVGNVDAWLLFSLGVEDMDDAWKIVNGTLHGWRPQDLVDGLRPHETAMAVSGTLLKLTTLPSPPADARASGLKEAVTASSRRYAQPEDSEASPFDLSSKQVTTFLLAFPDEGARTRAELAEVLGWPSVQVDAAVALCMSTGDVGEARRPDGCAIALRTRGLYHRDAIEASRNEGEEHGSLLADAAAFLHHRGIAVEIVPQEGGYLRPDAEFEWRGRTYSIEVECSTLVTHFAQVARNLRKAFAIRRRCLVVVEDRESAELFGKILAKEVPEAELWGEVGLMWREGVETMVPCDFGRQRPWGFLPGGIEVEDEDEDETEDVDEETLRTRAVLSAANDPHATDLARVFEYAKKLLAAGKTLVTAEDFEELFRPANGTSLDRLRLGLALETLGVKSYRLRENGRRVRKYDLTTLPGASGTAHPRGTDSTVAGFTTGEDKRRDAGAW